MKKTVNMLALMMATVMFAGCAAQTGGGGQDAETSANSASADSVASADDNDTTTEDTPEEVSVLNDEEVTALLEEGRDYYFARNGKERDLDKAMEIFEDVADKTGSADAWYMIGRVKEFRGDYEGARMAYETAVEKESDLARLALGRLYLLGYGVEADHQKSTALYEEAVANGCVDAYNGIGDLYQYGYGVEQDGRIAVENFLKATEGNDPDWVGYAFVSLGTMYNGNYPGVEEDPELRLQYFLVGAETENYWRGYGLHYAGEIYKELGETDNANNCYVQALDWYEDAADAGNLQWMANAGRMYINGTGTKKDPEKGIALITAAADAGFRASYYYEYLGDIFSDGSAGIQDDRQALEWYIKAADSGSGSAMNSIGWMYKNGTGVDVDFQKAIEWFRKAADAGDPYGMNNLGAAYANGNGVEVDYEMAYEWFEKAAENGNENGIEWIQWLVDNGHIDAERAAKWLE